MSHQCILILLWWTPAESSHTKWTAFISQQRSLQPTFNRLWLHIIPSAYDTWSFPSHPQTRETCSHFTWSLPEHHMSKHNHVMHKTLIMSCITKLHLWRSFSINNHHTQNFWNDPCISLNKKSLRYSTPSLTDTVTVSTCITRQTLASYTAVIGYGATFLLPIARALCTGTKDTGRTVAEVPVVARRTQLKRDTITHSTASHQI